MTNFATTVWDRERIYTVSFGRAKTGTPHMKFPDVDDVGFQDDANPSEHGQIASSMAGLTSVRVKVYRMEISTAAKLYAVSADPTIVKITDPADGALGATPEQKITFDAVKAGRTAIEIRYRWKDGPVIGRLYVAVYARSVIRLRLHLVTVNGFANPVANFFGANCPTVPKQQARLQWFIKQVNHTWVPHGIFLKPEATVYQTTWGATQIPSGSQSPTYQEMVKAGALSPSRSPASVNIYVMGQWNFGLTAALGIPVAWAKQQNLKYALPGLGLLQHLSNAVYLNSSIPVAASIVGHEFGHYMELCSLNAAGAVQQWHSTGDSIGGAEGVRDDLVSRRRVMYPITTLLGSGFSWRADVGYGNGVVGAFITYRRLTQDITFEESNRARTAAAKGSFYAI
jgi:hypothetical protein